MIQLSPQNVFLSDLLAGEEWLVHGFGSRDSAWPEAAHLALVKQFHSADVLTASTPGLQGPGDAIVTAQPGLFVGVKTADCVPVLLADPEHRAVAAIHAGWKGTAAEIVLAAIERMRTEFGTRPEQVKAAIGPCIQSCCYEVGPEVVRKFQKWSPELAPGRPQKISLVEINQRQLASAGVCHSSIDVSAHCTFCHPELLHSYRREGDQAGRMISFIARRIER